MSFPLSSRWDWCERLKGSRLTINPQEADNKPRKNRLPIRITRSLLQIGTKQKVLSAKWHDAGTP
jgi:hypothetical protein